MASIDKIYGTEHEWVQVVSWLMENKRTYLRYIYARYGGNDIQVISNFSCRADVWLYKHCPLEFLKERMREQYQGEPHL